MERQKLRLRYGELDGVISSRLQRVHEVMSDAGFETKASTTINRESGRSGLFLLRWAVSIPSCAGVLVRW
jgi:hypothetical protein